MNEKRGKRAAQIAAVILCFALLAGLPFAAQAIKDRMQPDIDWNDNLWDTPEYDFADDTVWVVLTREVSDYHGLSQERLYELFGFLDYESIRDHSAYENPSQELIEHFESIDFKNIISIKLKTKSKRNVLDVVEQLSALNYVDSAEPDYYSYPCDD